MQGMTIAAVCLGPVASDARAADIAAPLGWSAAAGCPDRDAAASLLTAQLRGPLPEATGVQVDLAATGSGYVATIAITGTESFAARTLVAGDCDALARAAILVVAVAIDPVAVVGPSDPVDPLGAVEFDERAPRIPNPPLAGDRGAMRSGSADRDVSPDPPSRTRRRRARWGHAVRVAGGIGAQVVPSVMGAVQLGHAAIASLWRIESTATWLPPVARRYADGAGVRTQAFTLGVRACPSPRLGRVTVPVCVGVVGGPVRGRGTGVPRLTDGTSAWLAAEVGVAAIIAVHRRVGLVLGVDGFAALVRPAFHLGSRPDVLATPSVGGRGLLGIEVRLR